MPAPPILRDVFHALRDEWGEERDGITFDQGPPPLERLDVMVYGPSGPGGTTAFATIGMSAHAMPPRAVRAELRLFRRGPLAPPQEQQLAMRLANLAAYPWTRGEPLDWGEIVGFGDEIPAFPGCRSVFLAGPWTVGRRATVETRVAPVRILNAVPISETERERALTARPETFFSDLLDTRDVCAPPPHG
ncbi:suppressor of fused domain protein [Streptomyces oryzae]|uniref:Suppressor of fused domain protein n=1 Tax=Streptomyces oryzae TaxID=1434886 RepID=A0ABS3XKU8_9ACTN|nr:suppressor of fused domain protein [Streptomyces oryzae]MBO8196034.1 suppressor of fused domain protein [Streptomyces oryzae]